MAYGGDPESEQFRRNYFEEIEGQLFLKPPKGAEASMPISYEFYLELLDTHETELRITQALMIMCTIAGFLYGAYRWAVSGDLLLIPVFAGVGIVAGLIGGVFVAMHGAMRMSRIYLAWARTQAAVRSTRASDDALF